MQSSGEMSRESAKLCLPTTPHAVIARLDRAIQYSRDRNESSETLRRTGFPAGACHRARQRRDPVAGNDSACCRDRAANQARHCEERSDEAIQKSHRGKTLDCFAALAMTMLIHGCTQSPLWCDEPPRHATGRSSIPTTGMIHPRRCGVLDSGACHRARQKRDPRCARNEEEERVLLKTLVSRPGRSASGTRACGP